MKTLLISMLCIGLSTTSYAQRSAMFKRALGNSVSATQSSQTSSGNSSTRGSSTYSQANTANNTPNGTKVWREDSNLGGFAIVTQYPNGTIRRKGFSICISCKGTKNCGLCYGTGMCSLCNGQGGIITAGYGNYLACVSCNQTGLCSMCKGNKLCSCNSNEYPGYMPISDITIFPDGSSVGGSFAGGSSDNNSSSNHSSTRRSCPGCHGEGKWTDEVIYSPNYTGGDNRRYCNVCDEYTFAHYHRKPMCRVCNGRGYVE